MNRLKDDVAINGFLRFDCEPETNRGCQSKLCDDIKPETEQEGAFSSLLSPQRDPLHLSLREALRPLVSKTACTCFFFGSREKKKDWLNGHRKI